MQIEPTTKLGISLFDQVHQNMILHASGQGKALKRYLIEQRIRRDQGFWRLAQIFSALYPSVSDEKR